MKPISRATSNRRLEKLAKFLETRVPKERFNMETFFHVEYDDGTEESNWGSSGPELTSVSEALECGTSACVAGWAAVLFRRVFPEVVSSAWGTPTRDVGNRAGVVLGLTFREQMDLFNSSADHQTPKEAAKAIRQLIKARDGQMGWGN